jgi:ketosteroid isomerase-like protein
MAALEGPAEHEVQQLDVIAGGDVAFSRALTRFRGTTKDGTRTPVSPRWPGARRG